MAPAGNWQGPSRFIGVPCYKAEGATTAGLGTVLGLRRGTEFINAITRDAR